MPGEVITLQLGSYANYVGAHYWNFQVSLALSVSTKLQVAASQLDTRSAAASA